MIKAIFECPACGTKTENEKSFECTSCKCYFEIDSDNNIKFVKSGQDFNVTNFIYGIFYLLIIFGLAYFFRLNRISILELGFGYLAITILMMIRILFSQLGDDQKTSNALIIVSGIFNGRIKYYDIGSKFFAYSWVITGILGIAIIISGFLIG